jgi:hypothetical protein
MQYSVPKFQAQAIKIESLSDELLDYLISEIKGEANQGKGDRIKLSI